MTKEVIIAIFDAESEHTNIVMGVGDTKEQAIEACKVNVLAEMDWTEEMWNEVMEDLEEEPTECYDESYIDNITYDRLSIKRAITLV